MSRIALHIALGSIGLLLITLSFESTSTIKEIMSGDFENSIIEEISYEWVNTKPNVYNLGLAISMLSLVGILIHLFTRSDVVDTWDSSAASSAPADSLFDSSGTKTDMVCTLTYPFLLLCSTFFVALFVCLWTNVLLSCFLVTQLVRCNAWMMHTVMCPSVVHRYVRIRHLCASGWERLQPVVCGKLCFCYVATEWLFRVIYQGVGLIFKYLFIFTGINILSRRIDEWRKRNAIAREEAVIMKAIESNYVFVDADTLVDNLIDECHESSVMDLCSEKKNADEESIDRSGTKRSPNDSNDDVRDGLRDDDDLSPKKNKNDVAWYHLSSVIPLIVGR